MKSFRLALRASALGLLVACEATPPPVTPSPPPPAVVAAPLASPPPADPAPVTDGDITVGYANGMQIIVKRIPGAELASSQLNIRGGVRNWQAADAGVERLALSAAVAGGTVSLDKDAFARKLAALGSNISARSTQDYSAIQAKCLTAKWDETFALLAGTFLHPALPASEIEVQRAAQIAELRREQENPDAALQLLMHKTVFAGHPYANRAIGTLESVSALKADALRAHLGKLRETNRLVLVVVGDLDPAHVIAQAKTALGALPRGAYTPAPLPQLSFTQPTVTTAEKKLATNYIQGVFPAPGWTDPDFAGAMMTMNVLAFRLFEEIRTKRNLSYAPGANFGWYSAMALGSVYVSAVDPNTTVKVIYDEIARLKKEPVPEKELAGTKETFLTGYLMRNEATDGQAGLLSTAALIGGDWKLGRGLPERIRAVTAADVQRFAQKYIGRLQVVVLGDPAKIDKALFGSL
jgi:zinc protease